MKKLVIVGMSVLALATLSACLEGTDEEGPQGSVSIGPAAVVRGAYTKQQNDCPNDESDLTIVQDINTLLFKGGFDYQAASPDQYDGFLDEEGKIQFTIEGAAGTVTCTASVTDKTLTGTCTGGPAESCSFTYLKKSEE